MADLIMDGVDKIHQEIMTRDRADVAKLRAKSKQIESEGSSAALEPLIIAHAAEAADRLHKSGDLYGGLGQKDFEALQKNYYKLPADQRLRSKK